VAVKALTGQTPSPVTRPARAAAGTTPAGSLAWRRDPRHVTVPQSVVPLIKRRGPPHPPPAAGRGQMASRASPSRRGPGTVAAITGRRGALAGPARDGRGPGPGTGATRSRITWVSTLRRSALAISPFTSALPDVHGCLLTGWILLVADAGAPRGCQL